MNAVIRRAHPCRNLLCLGLGATAAAAGIWISSAVELMVVQGIGFLLLAPAGVLLAVGLCRLLEDGRESGRLALPPLPPALRRKVTLARILRTLRLSLARGCGVHASPPRDTDRDSRPPSWAE